MDIRGKGRIQKLRSLSRMILSRFRLPMMPRSVTSRDMSVVFIGAIRVVAGHHGQVRTHCHSYRVVTVLVLFLTVVFTQPFVGDLLTLFQRAGDHLLHLGPYSTFARC